ncbi:MAG TPA: TetR/AcrR family transcriptional regulator [Thermodesulfobacteriota bacterium]|nr:TetR/AcrR family transcriptional regulator [Thermodesulfobacteriota bacterium]
METEKRNQVLTLAKKKFERFGFSKTTVDEIAKDAGISKRTLYQEFENKEKILEELFMFEALSVRKAILNQIGKISDPAEKLETYIRLAIKYLNHNPFIVSVLHDESGFFAPFLKDKPCIIEEGIQEIIFTILKEGVSKGVFRKMDGKLVARSIFLLFKGLTYGRRSPDRPLGLSQTNEFIHFVRHGVAIKSKGAPHK